ncbi:MAG: SDR family NAD(P)-dependent oxidoreductase [Planctomycetota bacterium]|nr:MAG: SDR family NAD(P)-dependent oxidoreductase [Planctomycetota bacterium]
MSNSSPLIWITGAGSGLGRALALEYGRRGASVALSGRRVERLEQVGEEVEAAGGTALCLPADVTSLPSMESARDRIAEQFGGLDVAIANAGIGIGGAFSKLSEAEWRRQFEVNFFGLITTVRLALPLLEVRQGRLALIASVAAFLSGGGNAPYCSSKAAVRAFGLCLAQELHGTGTSCTLIHPGFVESEIGQVDNQGVYHPDFPDRRPQKLMWPADRAAKVMVKAIDRRKREYVFTKHGRFGAFVGKHSPGLVHFLATRFQIGF